MEQYWITAAGMLLTLGTFVGSLVWWLARQFTEVKELIYNKINQTQDLFVSKLEYHEKHDDQRFTALSNDLWELKVRAAARDGLPIKGSRGEDKAS